MLTAPDVVTAGVARKHTSGTEQSPRSEHEERAVLSVLSHDLCQPLSTIDACAEYLKLVLRPGDEGALDKIEIIQQQAATATRMLRDAMLKLSYAETRPGPPESPVTASRPLTKASSAGVVYSGGSTAKRGLSFRACGRAPVHSGSFKS
jgi:signal transduction histidine kinase